MRVSEQLLSKVRPLGAVGEEWLRSLPATLTGLERDWDLRLGGPLSGGTGAYVTAATRSDGSQVV